LQNSESLKPESFPTKVYADLLDEFLEGGRVNYQALSVSGRERLDLLEDTIARTSPEKLAALSDKPLIAWYINAYNILTLKLIVDNYPLESIRDLESPWDTPMTVAGSQMTLNEIEHKKLRRVDNQPAERRALVDPRLHFAVNCASIGCPVLQPEPFTMVNLPQLYEKGVRDFLAVPENYSVEGETLLLSELLNWYGEDFLLLHDPETELSAKEALGLFFADRESDADKAALLRSGAFDIQWSPYDWDLNEL